MIRLFFTTFLLLCFSMLSAQESLGNGYQFNRPKCKPAVGLQFMASKAQGSMLGLAGVYDIENLWFAQVQFGGQLGTVATAQNLRPNLELELQTQMRTIGLHAGKDVLFFSTKNDDARFGLSASASLGYYWLKHQAWAPRDNGGLRYTAEFTPVIVLGNAFRIRTGYQYASVTTVPNQHFLFIGLNGIINLK